MSKESGRSFVNSVQGEKVGRAPQLRNVAFDQIVRDDDFNARGRVDMDDPEVIELAESIEKIGLLEPLVTILQPDPATQEDVPFLIAGFRRHSALGRIRQKALAAKQEDPFSQGLLVVISPLTRSEAMLANLAENEGRRALPPWRTAERIVRLEQEGFSPKDISKAIARSEGYTRDLATLKRHLAPELWDVFSGKRREPAGFNIQIPDLLKIARFGDKRLQVEELESRLARFEARREGKEGNERGKRASKRQLEEALIGARQMRSFAGVADVNDDVREAVRATIRWVLGLDRKRPFR